MGAATQDLFGRVAVVTGAAGGIGVAIVRRLASAGATVFAADRDAEGSKEIATKLQKEGLRVFGAAVDVSDPKSVTMLVNEVHSKVSQPVAILVNNAGVRGPSKVLWQMELEEWRSVLSVDLDGVFLCCRAFLPDMFDQSWGRVINIASVYGKEGFPTQSAYAAAKAGVIALGRSLSREVAQKGVLVHTVVPGIIRSPMSENIDPQEVQRAISLVPLGRPGEPEEVAALVGWLAGSEITFSTGSTWDVSGGKATS